MAEHIAPNVVERTLSRFDESAHPPIGHEGLQCQNGDQSEHRAIDVGLYLLDIKHLGVPEPDAPNELAQKKRKGQRESGRDKESHEGREEGLFVVREIAVEAQHREFPSRFLPFRFPLALPHAGSGKQGLLSVKQQGARCRKRQREIGWRAQAEIFLGSAGLLVEIPHAHMSEVDTQPPKENPLTNILVNVLIPVLALGKLSKDPALVDEPRFYHLGPIWALAIALAFPIGYGIWFLLKHKKLNFFSVLGLVSVLLTGGLTLFLWNKDGSVDPSAPILFGLKEASIPFVLGMAVFVSHWTKTPLLNTFLYNDQIFDIKRIKSEIEKKSNQEPYAKLLFQCTLIFAGSFLISTVLNFFLAQYFLGPAKIDYNSENARVLYNQAVSSITWVGFLVIGVPIMAFLVGCMLFLLKGLRQLTGLENDELMLPR